MVSQMTTVVTARPRTLETVRDAKQNRIATRYGVLAMHEKRWTGNRAAGGGCRC